MRDADKLNDPVRDALALVEAASRTPEVNDDVQAVIRNMDTLRVALHLANWVGQVLEEVGDHTCTGRDEMLARYRAHITGYIAFTEAGIEYAMRPDRTSEGLMEIVSQADFQPWWPGEGINP